MLEDLVLEDGVVKGTLDGWVRTELFAELEDFVRDASGRRLSGRLDFFYAVHA